MGLNLQSMLASPFVRPFLTEVRNWEQKLSLIGELCVNSVWQADKFSLPLACVVVC